MRKILLVLMCTTAVILLSIYLWTERTRFTILQSPGNVPVIYKLDRKTGRVWWITPSQQREVLAEVHPHLNLETPEQTAIRLAKESYALGPDPAETVIRTSLQNQKGFLRPHGWKTWRVDDDNFVVAYSFDNGEGTPATGWYFEVNIPEGIVRRVDTDPEFFSRILEAARAKNSVQQILDSYNLPRDVKARAWEAWYATKDPKQFETAFQALPLPSEAKDRLLRLRFAGADSAFDDAFGSAKR